jgi:hypothetical protein
MRKTLLNDEHCTWCEECGAAAGDAHDRCFIGHTLTTDVAYEVGSVEVRKDGVLA